MPSTAMINMVSSLSGLLGPALGGMAYSVWGIYPVLAIAAGCFFLSAVMEIFIHMPHQKRPMEKSVLQETKADFTQSITYICREKSEVGKVIAWIIAVSTCAQPIGQMMYGFLFEKVSGTLELIFYISAVFSVLIAWGSKRASGRLNLKENYDEQLSSTDKQSLQNV